MWYSWQFVYLSAMVKVRVQDGNSSVPDETILADVSFDFGSVVFSRRDHFLGKLSSSTS
jgi:hypothetical protein